MRNLTHQFMLRVDDDLYDALHQDAVENGRTVAQSARYYLRAVFPALEPRRGG